MKSTSIDGSASYDHRDHRGRISTEPQSGSFSDTDSYDSESYTSSESIRGQNSDTCTDSVSDSDSASCNSLAPLRLPHNEALTLSPTKSTELLSTEVGNQHHLPKVHPLSPK